MVGPLSLKKNKRISGLSERLFKWSSGPFDVDSSNTRGFDLAVFSMNDR